MSAVAGGKVVQVQERIRESRAREIDATGLHTFPAVLDAHVHFNEPGRTEWEGLASGSSSLAAGGGAWFCDMPLNSTPPVLDAATFAAKRRWRSRRRSRIFRSGADWCRTISTSSADCATPAPSG